VHARSIDEIGPAAYFIIEEYYREKRSFHSVVCFIDKPESSVAIRVRAVDVSRAAAHALTNPCRAAKLL